MLLDGFPRTLPQAEKLDEILAKDGVKITNIVNMKIDESLLVERICGRRIHKESGRSYHLKFNPPKVDGKDDITGEPLIQRSDDNEEALKSRMDAFHKQTMPILGYYDKRGIVSNIDSGKSFAQVWTDIQTALE
jgi:adenylate kinase